MGLGKGGVLTFISFVVWLSCFYITEFARYRLLLRCFIFLGGIAKDEAGSGRGEVVDGLHVDILCVWLGSKWVLKCYYMLVLSSGIEDEGTQWFCT